MKKILVALLSFVLIASNNVLIKNTSAKEQAEEGVELYAED